MRRVMAAACSLVVASCSTAETMDTAGGRPPPEIHAGNRVVAAIGTPFYLVFKGAVCVATVAVAGPLAGIASLSANPASRQSTLDALGDGVGHNCGPPYALTP